MKLLKQRTIWLPTWWGVLWVFVILTSVLWLFIQTIGPWLAQTSPVAERQMLVVEGWQTEPALLDAYRLFQQQEYDLLITTGGPDNSQITPLFANFAEQAANFLRRQGLSDDQIVIIPAPASAQNRTYLSAVMVRDWLQAENIQLSQLNVHSSHVHARRTRRLYQKALPDIEIGIYATTPEAFSLQHWWQTSDGAKSVFTELLGNVWITCCFYPGEPGSHYEKWAVE